MFFLTRIAAIFSLLLLMSASSLGANVQGEDAEAAVSPLRLSYVEGDVSFYRDGAEDWVEARYNTPLAAGDALYVGNNGDLELQMGSRAFIRADDETQFTLMNQTADFIQFKITSGRMSFDLRSLPAGYTVEVGTPNAVFTIDRSGYYRVDVNGDVHFITRRGGRAMMVPAGGQAMSIRPSEEIVVQGGPVARATTYVAPELDRWDRWNYERTDNLVDTVSERYLPSGIAGASDLDHYGRWRVVGEYGPVWVPDGLPSGWAPYSLGRWVWDPYYQWTWIDDAPWGWAPFHYGRWVYLDSYWAWAPGPAVRVGVYSPALVAFFGIGSGTSVSIGVGTGGLGWVALSWGEPVIPWWGRPGFVGRPWWGGWHGPRVVNNVVVRQNTVVNVTNINYYNTRVNNAVVATTRDHFGRGHVSEASVRVMAGRELRHMNGTLPVKPERENLVAGAPRGSRPPDAVLSRSVISTRPARESALPWRGESSSRQDRAVPEPRYVSVPKRPESELPRPEFGNQAGEERSRPPMPPRFEERRRESEALSSGNSVRERVENIRREPGTSRTAVPDAQPPRSERETVQARPVPEREKMRERTVPEARSRVESVPSRPGASPEPVQREVRTERQDRVERRERADLPGQSANRMYRGQDRESGERRRSRPAD